MTQMHVQSVEESAAVQLVPSRRFVVRFIVSSVYETGRTDQLRPDRAGDVSGSGYRSGTGSALSRVSGFSAGSGH